MIKDRAIITHVKAFISLWGIPSFIDGLAEIDHQRSLSSNSQLAAAGAKRIAEARSNTRGLTIRRCKLLRKKLGFSFLLLATAVVVAVVFGLARLPQDPKHGVSLQSLAGIGSIFSFAWASVITQNRPLVIT